MRTPTLRETTAIALLAFGAAAVLYLRPLGSSLWIDETSTFWCVDGDLATAIDRSFRFQGNSPLYYALEWAITQLCGRSEAAMRLPSVLATALAIPLVARLGARVGLTPVAAWAGALAFACMPDVVFAAGDARVYALGVLAAIGAGLALRSWLETGRTRAAAGYVALAALTIHLHYLFATVLIAHALAWLEARRAGRGPSIGAALGVALALAVALLPSAGHFAAVAMRRQQHSWAGRPDATALLHALVPTVLPAVALLALGVASLFARARPLRLTASAGPPAWLIAWAVAPAVCLFAASRAGDASVFLSRYTLVAAPATALVFGWIVGAIEPACARGAVWMGLGIGAMALGSRPAHMPHDWRGALAAVRAIAADAGGQPLPILVQTSFAESRDPAWLADPERASYLLSPLAFYPIGAPATALPYAIRADTLPFVDRLTDALAAEPRFVLVAFPGEDPFRTWLELHLGPRGYHSRSVGDFGQVHVLVFEAAGR